MKSKQIALEWCFDLWMWLACNPGKSKWEWPSWKGIGGCNNGCPLCEWVFKTKKRTSCETCPIDWVDSPHLFMRKNCLARQSPYELWSRTSDHKEKTKYALEICALAAEAME